MEKSKISILGPFNNRGGREIEAGFIADVLNEKYIVNLYSFEYISIKNDINSVNKTLSIYGKYVSVFSKIKNKLGLKPSYNKLKFKSISNGKIIELTNVIKSSDVIFIVAQVLSHHIDKVVTISKKYNKKIILRTTGTIAPLNLDSDKYDLNYLNNINEYVHHTEQNAKNLLNSKKHKYKIIDQTIFNEEELIKKRHSRTNIKKFYTCSRLDTNKNIGLVIKAFNKLKNYNVELNIYGNGYLFEDLKIMAKNKNIKFHGHIEYHNLISKVNSNDCLIISSKEEAGPYTGLEAMCLGIPIISTKVGGMPKRLEGFTDIWFNTNNEKGLVERIINFHNLDKEQIVSMQKRLCTRYDSFYAKSIIEKQYLELVEKYV